MRKMPVRPGVFIAFAEARPTEHGNHVLHPSRTARIDTRVALRAARNEISDSADTSVDCHRAPRPLNGVNDNGGARARVARHAARGRGETGRAASRLGAFAVPPLFKSQDAC